MTRPGSLWAVVTVVLFAVAGPACGSRPTMPTQQLKQANLMLDDHLANHAFSLVVGQTVIVQLINRATPAAASDDSVLKRTDSLDSQAGKVTVFQAIGSGATLIEPGAASCGLVACANSGVQGSVESFYILVTDQKSEIGTVLTLSDHDAIVALRQDERIALVLPTKAPFGPWLIPAIETQSSLVQEGVVTTRSFSWATFRALTTGRSVIQATTSPNCAVGVAGCPLGQRTFSATVSVVPAGSTTVLMMSDQDNGAQVELRAGEVIELALRKPPFDTGVGTIISIHPNVLIKVSSSNSAGTSKLQFRAVDGGFTQLLSVGPRCASGTACPSLYELNVFVFPQ
jgi:hypothetical protein